MILVYNNFVLKLAFKNLKGEFNMIDRVFYFFEQISKIPRGSGNEKTVSDYIKEFAQKNNLYVIQDEANNIIIKKPASEGYEDAPSVMIQGHMDMVCEKKKESNHDFAKDPIEIIYDGDFIRANMTTLGGDDGIAVAMGMAIAENKNLKHPALEIVFTADEEIGMIGANKIDCSNLNSRYVLNIDSENEGIFTAGCAGGLKSISDIPFNEEKPPYDNFAIISVGGLKGGHSGIDIDKRRANANVVLADVLYEIGIDNDIRIAEINGGAKDNAIPRDAEAVICYKSDISEKVKYMDSVFKKLYSKTDENIFVKFESCDKRKLCFDKKSSEKITAFIMNVPNGIISLNDELGIPETSNNTGVVRTEKNSVVVTGALRSAVAEGKRNIFNKICSLSESLGGSTIAKGDYPAWEYKEDSKLRKIMCDTYREIFGKEPKIDIIHAGLECGLFYEKMKDADIISYGPDMFDIHTPDERLSISSAERTYNFTLKVLENMKG